jgi:hypothetical protein
MLNVVSIPMRSAMRKQLQISGLVLVALAVVPRWTVSALEGDAKAASIMSESRKALGGEKKLSTLKGLSLRAEFKREMAGGGPGGATFVINGGSGSAGSPVQMSGTLEVDVLFPDKFFRQETTTSGFGLTRTDGFDSTRPFLDVASSSPGVRVMGDNPASDPVRAKAALKRMNTELARLLLGIVGTTQAGLPVAYTYAGQAESPDGTAHVIDVTGPEDFKARLFVDTTTHLPLMLTYSELEPRPMRMVSQHGGPPAGGGGAPRVVAGPGGSGTATTRRELTAEERAEIEKETKAADETPRKMLEYRLYFSDYREVEGVRLPHRIARGTTERTVEEWEVKSYKVNPAIKADRFKVGTE